MRLVALTLLINSASAQSLPLLVVAAGGTYSRAVTPATAAGWLSFGVQAASPRVYSLTTTDFGQKPSLRTGIAYLVVQARNLSLLTHADGGLTTSGTATVGSVSGGAMLAWEIPRLKNWYLIGVVRLVAVAGVGARPVYEFGVGRGI